MTKTGKKGFLRAGLFRRIYFHTLMVIVLVMTGVGLLFHLRGPQHNFLNVINQLSRTITDQIDFKNSTRAELETLLDEMHHITDMSFALIGRDNAVYARSGQHQLMPLETVEVEQLFHDHKATHFRPAVIAFPLKSKTDQPDAYLLVKINSADHHWSLLASLIAVFVIVAAVSIPLTRTISRPLEKLTHTASEFAAGNLSARTGIETNDELGVLARSMDHMALKLADRIRAEKELLANVSHELRTPLSRIKVALALCDTDTEIEVSALQKQLTGIEGDVADLERLIADVMDVARYDLSENNDEKSSFMLRKKSSSLNDIVVAARQRFAAMGYSQSLSLSTEKNLHNINIDPGLIKRVIDNLLDNAVRYSTGDSKIELIVSQTANAQVIEIRDEGIGISAEDLTNIFEPFFRTDRSRNRGTGGTGLGLTLSRRIVAAHGGQISAGSDGEHGATFRVELPI